MGTGIESLRSYSESLVVSAVCLSHNQESRRPGKYSPQKGTLDAPTQPECPLVEQMRVPTKQNRDAPFVECPHRSEMRAPRPPGDLHNVWPPRLDARDERWIPQAVEVVSSRIGCGVWDQLVFIPVG